MTDRQLSIQTEEIQTDGKDSFHFHRYEPTPYDVLDRLCEYWQPSPDDVVVDYGCGLGRLNFYLENRFHAKSTGIEFSEFYYQRAKENLASYNGKKDAISFICCQAEEYAVSDCENVFYFFNPFSADVFRKVINRILLSFQSAPRTITLLLYYPEDDTIFYLESHTAFRLIREAAACEDIRSDRRERFCIYQLSAGPV